MPRDAPRQRKVEWVQQEPTSLEKIKSFVADFKRMAEAYKGPRQNFKYCAGVRMYKASSTFKLFKETHPMICECLLNHEYIYSPQRMRMLEDMIHIRSRADNGEFTPAQAMTLGKHLIKVEHEAQQEDRQRNANEDIARSDVKFIPKN